MLIAEDEMLVRLALKHSINWNEFDMTVIADVTNGQEALDIFRREMPEVLITDIKMPVMDGMELIAKIRELDANTEIAILSCVEDFDVVRKALAFNVHDYILKLEMTTEDMGKILTNIRTRLDRLHKPVLSLSPKDIDMHILKDNLVKDFLFGSRYNEVEFAAKAANLEMRLNPQQVAVILMEIDQFDHLCERFKDKKGQLVRMSLLNILNEVIANYGYGEAYADADSRYILLFGFEDTFGEQKMVETLYKIVEHIRSVLYMYFNNTVTFVMHDAQQGYHSMKEQYRECMKALEAKFFLGYNCNIKAGEQTDHVLPDATKEHILRLVLEWNHANEYEKKMLEKKVRMFIAHNGAVSAGMIKQTIMHWLHLSALSMSHSHVNMPEIVSAYSERVSVAGTLQELVDIFREYLDEMIHYMPKRTMMSKEISEVIRYIDEHYAEELTLHELADAVQVSPNYLSSLFKKETGINFADYLLQHRIEKAKELLLGTFCKTYEVAEQTGFANQSYFSRAFKKITGVGPKEFRRKGMVNWGNVEVPHDETL
ncbi:response regulator transcription factor [Paenibacillus eucommiae]|uniref:response regulator transcription factor n=1 Tax=Paenibacillus eucommiae TaxID=1355755 RepID=UPI0028AB4218|nr:helix-turn-helix domain-containing protein [Paenibacillus eucommiae]